MLLYRKRVDRLRAVDAYFERALYVLKLDRWRHSLVLANGRHRLQGGFVQFFFRGVVFLSMQRFEVILFRGMERKVLIFG